MNNSKNTDPNSHYHHHHHHHLTSRIGLIEFLAVQQVKRKLPKNI
jgi:hypothetical protein